MLWMGLIFGLTFVIFYPVFLLFMFTPKHHKYLYGTMKLVGNSLFRAGLIKIKTTRHPKIDSQKIYIYCPNHTSYIDIPLITATIKHFICFVGKQGLAKVPLFGLMFRKVHIPIDRNSRTQAYKALEDAKKRLELGQSVCVFPQGGIKGKGVCLSKFKDGAFKLALETGIPIVPVSIPYNWSIMGADFRFYYQKRLDIIYHEPIQTANLTESDLETLKQKTYEPIASQLEAYFPNLKQPPFRHR